MASELTYSDIKQAIYEALSEHSGDMARYGSAENKIRKESRDLTSQLLNEIKAGFKNQSNQNDRLQQQLKQSLNAKSNGKPDELQQKASDFFDKTSDKHTKMTTKFFKGLDKNFGKLLNTLVVTITALSKVHGMSLEYSSQILNGVKNLNINGINSSYKEFQYALIDSTIRLEDLNKSIEGHTQAFAVLNKTTGNAVGTYQNLAKKASEYAIQDAKIAYDSSQTSEALNAYLEMQRNTGNLDRLNQEEMQYGINRLMKSADNLAKEMGISRDALIKNMGEEKLELETVLAASRLSPDEIYTIQQNIESLKLNGETQLAEAWEKFIISGGTDSALYEMNAAWNSPTVAKAMRLAPTDLKTATELMISEQAQKERAASLDKFSGSLAAIYQTNAGTFGTAATQSALQAKRAMQARGGEQKTDESLIKAQNKENKQIQNANDKIFAFSKSVDNLNSYLDNSAKLLDNWNKALIATGKTMHEISQGTIGKGFGWLSAGLDIVGKLASLFIQYKLVTGGLKILSNIPRYLKIAKGGKLNLARKISKKIKWTKFKNWTKDAFSKIKNWGKGAFSKIKGLFSDIWTSAKNWFSDFKGWFSKLLGKNPKNANKLAKTTKDVAKNASANASKIAASSATASKLMKGVGKGAGIIGIGLQAADSVNEIKKGYEKAELTGDKSDINEGYGRAAGGWAAFLGGIGAGIAAGSVGGIPGAIIGGIVGGIASFFLDEPLKEMGGDIGKNWDSEKAKVGLATGPTGFLVGGMSSSAIEILKNAKKELNTSNEAKYNSKTNTTSNKDSKDNSKQQLGLLDVPNITDKNNMEEAYFDNISQMVSNSKETNQKLEKILYTMERQNRTNV